MSHYWIYFFFSHIFYNPKGTLLSSHFDQPPTPTSYLWTIEKKSLMMANLINTYMNGILFINQTFGKIKTDFIWSAINNLIKSFHHQLSTPICKRNVWQIQIRCHQQRHYPQFFFFWSSPKYQKDIKSSY